MITPPTTAQPSKEFVEQQRIVSTAPAAAAKVERLNVCQFVLHQHTVLSLCFRKAGKSKSAGINLEEFSARERIFIFVFVTSCTLAVAMTSAIWLTDTDGGTVGAVLVTLSTIVVTLLVITPVTVIVKCLLKRVSAWLRSVQLALWGCLVAIDGCGLTARCARALPPWELALASPRLEQHRAWDPAACPPSPPCAVACTAHRVTVSAPRLEEVALLVWVVYVATCMSDPSAYGALRIAGTALLVQYAMEIPSILAMYVVCRACCKCCLPGKDEFEVLPDAAPPSEP